MFCTKASLSLLDMFDSQKEMQSLFNSTTPLSSLYFAYGISNIKQKLDLFKMFYPQDFLLYQVKVLINHPSGGSKLE